MLFSIRSLRRRRYRRAAEVLLVCLQVVVGALPLVENHHERLLQVHMQEKGAPHTMDHGGPPCVFCTVRLQDAAPAPRPVVVREVPAPAVECATGYRFRPARVGLRSDSSRAPPLSQG